MGYFMPDIFDKYQLIKRIAQGGIAEVFLARQLGDVGGFSRQVAIKRMFPHLIDREDIITMFIDEARIVAELNHPAIVQTFDLGVTDGAFYIAMEYIDGLDLRRVCEIGIENDAFLPAEIAVQIIIEAAAGLHYAHTRVDADGNPMNIVHRDVSPQNILISRQGAVKICDFGIAKAERRLTTTRSGEFKGKFGYMSPEQAEGLPLDARSDIFSLGIMLYEITVGTRLFRAFNEYETIKLVVNAQIEPPSKIVPNFPRDLEAIILKALQREPSKRFQTAEALQLALEDWLFTHRQRVGPQQIARYMELLFSKLPPETEDNTPLRTESAPASAVAVAAPAPAPAPVQTTPNPVLPSLQIQPRPGSSPLPTALNLPSPSTGLRLPAPRLDQASIDAMFADNVVGDDDLTRPFSPDQQRSPAPAPAAVGLPDPASMQHPAAPAATAIPAALPAPARLQPQPRPATPQALRPQTAPVQPQPQPPAVEPAPAPQKTWSVDPLLDDDDDTNWAQTHARRKTLFAGIAILGAVSVIGAAAWFLTQQPEPDTHQTSLAESPESTEVIHRGPLLDHPTTNVAVESTPPGAHIVVNGKLSGLTTPAEVALFRDTPNEIVLYSQGFLPSQLILTPSESTPVQSANLTQRPQPVAGKLHLKSTPLGATITLNGEQIGTTPMTLENIASNFEHHVQLSLNDHFTFAGFIYILPELDNTIDAILAPLDQPGRQALVEVAFEPLPRGSHVQLNGETLGISPFYSNQSRDSLLQLEVQAVNHQAIRRVIATSDIGSFLLRPYLPPIKREAGRISLSVQPSAANVYIGSRAYDAKQLRNIELLEGEYDAVFETTDGERLRTKIQVHPNQRTSYNVQLTAEQATVTVSQR